jgi:hypothetical protein
MNRDRTVEQLRALIDQSADQSVRREGPANVSWKARAEAVLLGALGPESATLAKFRDVRYTVGVWSGDPGEDARDARHFADAVDVAAALLEAAIFEVEVLQGDGPQTVGTYDIGLWQHVRHLVDEERWDQVVSQSVIYVEDKVRRWSGQARGTVGKGLFTEAFKQGGKLALGTEPNEQVGWLNLALGLVGAVGNVARHHVEDRSDGRLYGLGVVGLASLLLTQVKYEHPEETSASP